MPRKALGDRPLTAAERQARQRERKAVKAIVMRMALIQIIKAKTIHEARQIATDALDERPNPFGIRIKRSFRQVGDSENGSNHATSPKD